jgi:hypothetical protein
MVAAPLGAVRERAASDRQDVGSPPAGERRARDYLPRARAARVLAREHAAWGRSAGEAGRVPLNPTATQRGGSYIPGQRNTTSEKYVKATCENATGGMRPDSEATKLQTMPQPSAAMKSNGFTPAPGTDRV